MAMRLPLRWIAILSGWIEADLAATSGIHRNSELCDHVVAEDNEVDILEKQVDQDGLNVLIRFQPDR